MKEKQNIIPLRCRRILFKCQAALLLQNICQMVQQLAFSFNVVNLGIEKWVLELLGIYGKTQKFLNTIIPPHTWTGPPH